MGFLYEKPCFCVRGGLLSGISVSSVPVVRATIEISLVRDLSFMIDNYDESDTTLAHNG